MQTWTKSFPSTLRITIRHGGDGFWTIMQMGSTLPQWDYAIVRDRFQVADFIKLLRDCGAVRI